MRVFGIDPGSRHTGWGVVECVGSSSRALAWGRLSPSERLPLGERLLEIAEGLARLLDQHRPEMAAVECVFHGESSRALIVLAEARGALLVTLARAGLPFAELTPATIKSAVAGSGRADKEQVARMVKLQLGLPPAALPRDVTDALAVALACGQSAGRGRFFAP
ncbi:MAG TPA: crossover junction endodeoxyribonuclease RuvC [Thermoanaerobaculia bacterium]|nr:crossover junction endodeoxyribonuclease RuvC [Thermoanaerobaculia bacterium]